MLQLESRLLKLEILPKVGGKISRILLKAGGHELLIGGQREYHTIPPGGSWMDGDTSGIDDCFPMIAAGDYPFDPWRGSHFPPLGEWAYGAWEVLSRNKFEVAMRRKGNRLPYTAFKKISLAGDLIRLDYRVENQSSFPLRYLWALHPLLTVNSGFDLGLQPGALRFRVYPGSSQFEDWPFYGGVDLSRQWIAAGKTLKVFVSGLTDGCCDLMLDDYVVRFLFDIEKQPHLGLWFNNFGFPAEAGRPPFRCIAVEPCSAASDQLDELAPEHYPALPPLETDCWSVHLQIKS